MAKRLIDILVSVVFLFLLIIPLGIIALMIKMTSNGPALYWSRRVGRYNKIFLMPKLRSMQLRTPQVATHLLKDTDFYITPVGRFIRRTSIDELPQFFSVLKGDMSLVGPRPAIFNQDDLVKLRTEKKIDQLRPGITGWAQINGRDELSIPTKVKYDEYYLNHMSLKLDFIILFATFFKVLKKDGIKH